MTYWGRINVGQAANGSTYPGLQRTDGLDIVRFVCFVVNSR